VYELLRKRSFAASAISSWVWTGSWSLTFDDNNMTLPSRWRDGDGAVDEPLPIFPFSQQEPFMPEALSPFGSERLAPQKTKKADVAKHPKAFGHVGLLFNEPLGRPELLFI
jgi:hypothetical protein